MRRKTGDFPGGPVVKNPHYNAGDAGLIPGQRSKIPHAVGQLSPRATTTELACLNESPRAANYKPHVPWSLRTTTREEKSLHATTREKPELRNEELSCCDERSHTPQRRSHVPQLRPNSDKNNK